MKFPPQHAGFTLLEVLVVVAITAIMAISGFSAIVNLQRTARINDMNHRFASFLDLARNDALNGKLVSGGASGCGAESCVPNSYGATIRKVVSGPCALQGSGSGSEAVLFYLPSNAPQFDLQKIITMDSFCVNPQVKIYTTTAQGLQSDIAFLYSPPLGTFSTNKVMNTASEIDTHFCDVSGVIGQGNGATCDAKGYQKIITLYSNVGVPE